MSHQITDHQTSQPMTEPTSSTELNLQSRGPSAAHSTTQPNFFSYPEWARSALNTPIPLFSSHDLAEQMNPILLMGGVHGDEPEGVRLAQDTLDWLTQQKGLCPWVVVPCLNVDGYARATRGNGRGVDLNRNYPSKDWTNEFKTARYFPGESPASEPEIRSVVQLIADVKPRLIIHCHSWNPCVVATGELAIPDGERLANSCGYLMTPEIGYPTPGSLSRYGWHDLRIPVICIEEQDDLEDLHTIWPRFRNGMAAIFNDHGDRN